MYFRGLVLISLVAISITSPARSVDYKSEEFSLSKIPELEVRVNDNARNGCWTGISSARSNLRDKLELLGVQISENSPYRVLLEVKSSRTNDRIVFRRRIPGGCFGSARIIFYKKDQPVEENMPINILLMTDQTFTGYDNANNLVYSMIDNFIGDLK